jgi:hypothetical protein
MKIQQVSSGADRFRESKNFDCGVGILILRILLFRCYCLYSVVKGGLISESFSLCLRSPKMSVKLLP